MSGRRDVAIYVPALIGGGAERVAALLASALSAAGHDVTLVVDFGAPHNESFVDSGVERVTLAGAHAGDILQLAAFLKKCQRSRLQSGPRPTSNRSPRT